MTVAEGGSPGSIPIFVNLAAPSAQTVSVQYATSNGSATAGSDYLATSGTLIFKPGVTSLPITITVFGDQLYEPNESFVVQLSAPTNIIIQDSSGVFSLINDDPLIGVSELTPSDVAIGVGERMNFSLTWTHPERWRLLQTIDFRISDDDGAILWLRFDEPSNTFSVLNSASGNFGQGVAPGSPQRFETNAATLYLEDSAVQGSGPTGPSVKLTYSVSFKPKAAGRTYRVEVFATDDFGNQQGFDQVGTLRVEQR
jgi:hypothetical protein